MRRLLGPIASDLTSSFDERVVIAIVINYDELCLLRTVSAPLPETQLLALHINFKQFSDASLQKNNSVDNGAKLSHL